MIAGSLFSAPARLFNRIAWGLMRCALRGRSQALSRKLRLPDSVSIGQVSVVGHNIRIGDHTYFNSGYISSGSESSVTIGRWCAIGYNVTILAMTHDVSFPTGPPGTRPLQLGDVTIGDGTWIGNNAVILPGVTIGRQCVIGANTVVNADVPDYVVAAGIPCRTVRIRTPEELAPHTQSISKT